MMAGMNAILGTAKADPTILVGSLGIYYKIQNIAVLACFGLSGGSTTQIIDVCSPTLRISSIGFVFIGFSIAVQGVLQTLRYAGKPLIISLLRLVIFVFPIAYLFTLSDNVINLVWWTFPISKILTAIISAFILKNAYKQKIAVLEPTVYKNNLVISISREHGTNDKEIANTESCAIVGRSADYILRNNKNLVKIFLYAPEQYKIETIKKLYNDDDSTARKYMQKSDKARSTYYEMISNQIWGNKNNYDICLDCQIGNDEIVKIICNYVKNKINMK